VVNPMCRTTERSTVRNTTTHSLTLILEPWAFEYDIQPGCELAVEGEGPLVGSGLTTRYDGDFVTVIAWDGADARVLNSDGSVLGDWTGLRMGAP
jgi:hypothetical protein